MKRSRIKTADDYTAGLAINPDALDRELQKHPELYLSVARAAASARDVEDTSKEALKRLEADLFLRIRFRLEKTGEKYTEAVIKHRVSNDPEYQDAVSAYLAAKHTRDELEAVQGSFEQRSYMLRELARLWTTHYFDSTPVRDPAHAANDIPGSVRRLRGAQRKGRRD